MREILGFSSLLNCRQTVLAGYGRLDRGSGGVNGGQ